MNARNIAGTIAVGAAVYLFRNPKAMDSLKKQFQSLMSKNHTFPDEKDKTAQMEQGLEVLAEEGTMGSKDFTANKNADIGEDPYPKITTSTSQ
ncbi:hypothetical protein [Peribacillus deserti]|uniref:Uncharacterized protein n=1 Tax=Peribacillus deserti TaxID=673318 RepID=A0A2N5M541_9BACI|nr:hypothetical protein [Peribacillus deserti]PLT29477.1 hypothetical protein CUU66_12895 [Peribacillus deserti]